MTTTPLAASVPYSVAADGPLTISMFDAVRAVAAGADARRLVARHAHAVDHVDRVVVEREAVVAAHADARTRARLRAGKHLHAGGARVEQVGHVGDRRGRHDVLRVDVRDRVADLHAPGVTRRRGHDFLQRDHRLVERDVQRRRLTRSDRDRALDFRVADADHSQLLRTDGHVAERVATVLIGETTQVRADDEDLGVANRCSGSRFRHPTGDGGLRRLRCRRRASKKQRRRQYAEPGA
jgi:hypothetical protein